MSQLNKEDILKALSRVKYNGSDQNIVSAGKVSSIVIRDANVGFAIEADMNNQAANEPLRQQCEQVVHQLKGVDKVTAVLTSELSSKPETQTITTQPVTGVKHIIAVASGKGGVGKSTASVQLALALKQAGHRVGIVDADIYGPSIPHLLGINRKPDIDDNKMVPIEKNGLHSISIGYLVDQEKAAVWRGPMATKALYQLFQGTKWQDIDYLIVDMPPGTGDIQLSLAKNFPITGVVLVSTPKEIALIDVQKACDMFEKVNVPLLGVIENMSYFEDPASKNKTYIFGKDGAKIFAKKKELPFLGEIPILPDIEKIDTESNGVITSDMIHMLINSIKNIEVQRG